jgi:hypothetical protein
LRQWLDGHVNGRVSAKTLHRYREICELHLIPHLGSFMLAKLQPLQIQAAYAAMLREGRK